MTLVTARIAWRNLWRNRRRTGLALAAIGLSVALVLLYDGLLRAEGDMLVDTITGPLLGHAQVHAPGWRKDRAVDRTLADVGATLATVRARPDVAAASARTYAPALAALGDEGFAVLLIGLDTAVEARPTGLLATIAERPVGKRVLVGRGLAESMGVRAGDVIAVVGQAADGSLANELYTVAALAQTPVDFVNRQGVLLALPEAQELLAMPDRAHEIVVHGRDRDPSAAPALAAALARALPGTEVLSWQALAPEMLSLLELIDVAWALVLALVFAAAAAGVANTMLMSTFERTHELGMLLALGAPPGRVVALVVLEALALGVVGAALGSALGGGLVAITHETGLDLARLTGGGPSAVAAGGIVWSMRFYPSLALVDVARAAGAVIVTSLVAAIWPAVRAARLAPAAALRA